MQRLTGFNCISKLARSIAYNPPIQGSKVVPTISEAIKDIKSGSSICIGGYGPVGVPQTLINELANNNTKSHSIYVSTAGGENYGITPLLKAKKINTIITADLENNKELSKQYKNGEIRIQLTPMGTLAEKIRSGGMGVPAFYTPVGVGTMIEEGGIPVKLGKGGKNVEEVSDAKEKREFNDKEYLLEKTILTDFAFIKAWKADHKGNCIFKKCGVNFNADVASAGKICIVEADEIVETGTIDGEDVELGGIFVHRVVKSKTQPQPIYKPITDEEMLGTGHVKNKRTTILKRAAQEIKDGMYVYLAKGYPKLAKGYTNKGIKVDYFTETGVFGYEEAKDMKDLNMVDGEMRFISLGKGAAITKASDSFCALRGGHLSLVVATGSQVSQNGDLSNWDASNGPQCQIDQAFADTPLVVLMEHKNAAGKSNIVKECTSALTGKGCVSKLITDMAVFEFRNEEMVLTEIAPDVSINDVKKATDAEFTVEKDFKKMSLA